jgi:serine/threonine protein kinase
MVAAKTRKAHVTDKEFNREVENLKLLADAPNTVKLIDVFDEGNPHSHHIVMDLVNLTPNLAPYIQA